MHKYPVIGRFAEFARKRAYLWSFKTEDLRPSFYAGSILSLLPLMGVQLPVALILSLALRGNFMVMGGLQFITNPFTAVPVYYATHELGAKIIDLSGFGQSIDVVEATPLAGYSENNESTGTDTPQAAPAEPARIHWSKRIGTSINALVIGGITAGALLGTVLDFTWRLMSAAHHRRHPPRRKLDSHSTTIERPPE